MTFHRMSLTLCISLCCMLTACNEKPSPSAAEQPVLNLLIYSEYIDPDILAEFERRTGVRVIESAYESTEEAMAKLQHAGGDAQYDVVVITNQAVPVLGRLGVIQPLDHKQLSHLNHLDDAFTRIDGDPGNRYSVAYQWGTVGLMWNRKKHPELEPSWSLLFDANKQPGTFLLLDEMRDQLGGALLHLGHGVNTPDKTALKAAADLLIATKASSKCLGFEGGVGAKNKVAAGEADLAVVWNGDAVRAIEEERAHDRLAFGVPTEGSIIWVDVLTIPAKAPHADLAHQFLNFLLEAPVGASVSNFNKFATPNRESLPLIDQADRDNPGLYPDTATMKKLVYLKDMGETTSLYDEAWTAVKAR